MADVRKRLLRPAPKGCGPNRAKRGMLRMFTQFRRMAETLVDHALHSRGQVGYQRRADHGADRQGCSDPERTGGFRSIDRSRDRQELGRREGGSRRRRRHGHTAGFDHRPPDQEVRRDWRLAGRPGPGNDGGRRGGEVVRREAGQLAGRSRQRAERARPWGSHHASGHDRDAGAVIRTLWQSRRGCTVPEPGDGVGG